MGASFEQLIFKTAAFSAIKGQHRRVLELYPA